MSDGFLTFALYGEIERHGTLFVSAVQDGKRRDVAILESPSTASKASAASTITPQKVEGSFVVYECEKTGGCVVHVVTKNNEGNQEEKTYPLEKGETMHVSAYLGAASWCTGCS